MGYIIRKTGYGRSVLVNDVTQVIVYSVKEEKESELQELEKLIVKIKEGKK
jgi:hypothetical protein